MKKVNPILWLPADGMELEKNAIDIATSSSNALVVAGPGAGKTELLAQKACYLLQTNTCVYPKKILAISFKRDAAYNLKERVKRRCGDELSRRFDSFTFDSFAKQLLDRFKAALPEGYKIGGEYEILRNDRVILEFYKAIDVNYFSTTDETEIFKSHYKKLPQQRKTTVGLIRKNVWGAMLHARPSQVSFKMMMRLAELIVNSNPKIKQYLHNTYAYVFLDEFQDTTTIQYDFLKSCFLSSDSWFTAVGDDKQRIMLWAGAKIEVFDEFIDDTDAARVPLTMNFRSAPRLVTLQNYLTEHLLGKTEVAIPSKKWKPDQGECFVWAFSNPDAEMKSLFEDVQGWIATDNINPRDICLLVKQSLGRYAGELINYFNQNGIKARDEEKFQEMLTEEPLLFIIHVLYLIFGNNASEIKRPAFSFLANLHTEMEDEQLLRLDGKFSRVIRQMKDEYKPQLLTDIVIAKLIDEIADFADKNRIRAHYPSYKVIAQLNDAIARLREEVCKNFKKSKSIISALDMLVGKDTIPVMTIHKSKGLEYHTIIFIGLEDSAFWSYQKQPDEDKCAFFVALSRAKERVVFTFSKQRENHRGVMERQSLNNIREIIDQLKNSGVVTMTDRSLPAS